MSNLPTWPGADVCYTRAGMITDHLCRSSYQAAKVKKGWRPPEEATDLINAMNRGDEEAIKAACQRYSHIWAKNTASHPPS
jgi:hypothetical protein